MTGEGDNLLLASASAKVRRKVLPFLILCYFTAYLDRVNIGFAALTMNADLGIGPEAYGFVAGIFFAGYCLAEVPSNIALARFGARTWIARIMISWGLLSMATAFAQGPASLAVLRFLLGLAEAGFFPGIIYYLTRWVPEAKRADTVSAFMVAVPVSSVVGAPLSGWLLDATHGILGLKGWQWLFILEALPAALLGVLALIVLKDEPADAPWLTHDEAQALTAKIADEDAARARLSTFTLREALTDTRVLAMSLVYFGIVCGLYALTFWVPQIVKAFGLTNIQTGLIVAVPPLAGALLMVPWGRHSDKTGERRWHVALPAFIGCGGLLLGLFVTSPACSLAALTLAALGVYAALPTFWTLPTALLSGTAAAAAIALINAIGNIGGFAGPYIVGWLKGAGLSTAAAVAAISATMLMAGVLALGLGNGAIRTTRTD